MIPRETTCKMIMILDMQYIYPQQLVLYTSLSRIARYYVNKPPIYRK